MYEKNIRIIKNFKKLLCDWSHRKNYLISLYIAEFLCYI